VPVTAMLLGGRGRVTSGFVGALDDGVTMGSNATRQASNSGLMNALDNVHVPTQAGTATKLSGRLSNAEMAQLQSTHYVEFAQVYITGPGKNGGGGTTLLIRGSQGGVNIPVGSNVRVINHTHPATLNGQTVPLRPSTEDRGVLRTLQNMGSPQKSSQIVTESGEIIKFNTKGKVP